MMLTMLPSQKYDGNIVSMFIVSMVMLVFSSKTPVFLHDPHMQEIAKDDHDIISTHFLLSVFYSSCLPAVYPQFYQSLFQSIQYFCVSFILLDASSLWLFPAFIASGGGQWRRNGISAQKETPHPGHTSPLGLVHLPPVVHRALNRHLFRSGNNLWSQSVDLLSN